MDVFGREIQWLATLFYSDDWLLSFPRLVRLKEALYVLKGMFDRVGIQTNVKKTVGMVCYPCYMTGGHSEDEYSKI